MMMAPIALLALLIPAASALFPEPIPQAEQRHANPLVPKEHIAIGMRVVRGKDWQWHRQDGTTDVYDKSSYGKGTVVDAPVPWLNQTTHGVRVLWDRTDKSNIYRWGAHEKDVVTGDVRAHFDLRILPGEIKKDIKWRPPEPKVKLKCMPGERRALLRLYEATGGGVSWRHRAGWSQPMAHDACLDGWLGVLCDDGGHVVSLSLANNGLEGTLPAGVFGSLPKLKSVMLANNKLGGPLPADLPLDPARNEGKHDALQVLDVHDNALTGPLPESLGALPALEWFSAFNNRLTGTLPSGLALLTGLQYLFLANNRLTGRVPAGLAQLPTLKKLTLEGNDVSALRDSSYVLERIARDRARAAREAQARAGDARRKAQRREPDALAASGVSPDSRYTGLDDGGARPGGGGAASRADTKRQRQQQDTARARASDIEGRTDRRKPWRTRRRGERAEL